MTTNKLPLKIFSNASFLYALFLYFYTGYSDKMIYENISLKKFNSFGLNVRADHLATFKLEDNAIHFFKQHKGSDQNYLVIGRGSNVLFTGDFHGTIIHPEMEGITLEGKKGNDIIVSAGAGVIWDKLVESTVNNGLGGLENLSLIPGLVGAAAVQNIGAYGAEVKDTIEKVRAISLEDGSIREFTNDECRFGYRDQYFQRRTQRQISHHKSIFQAFDPSQT